MHLTTVLAMATTDTPKKSKNPLKSMVKRVGSFTKSASFSRSPSTKKMTKKDPAVEEAVRYTLIVLPVDGGKQFIQTVDGHKITFTAPDGMKAGQEFEFEFTYKGGQTLKPTPPMATLLPVPAPPEPSPPAAAEPEPVTTGSADEPVVAMAKDEPVLKSSADSSASSPDYKKLAKQVTASAIDTAVEAVEGPAKRPIVAMAEDEPVLKSSAMSRPPGTPASGSLGMRELMVALLVLAIAVKLFTDFAAEAPYLMDARAFVMQVLTPPSAPPPPPPQRRKFLNLF